MELLYYFLKVSACTVLFFAFYLMVLKRLTFFKINRFYLLITLLISFIIPTLQFTIERELPQTAFVNAPTVISDVEIAGPAYQLPIQVGEGPVLEESFDYYSLLPYLYLVIVIALLLVAGWRLFQLVKHTRNGVEKINGLKIVSKNIGFTNCSFFNYVFIDEENLTESELNILLKHEEVHARQLHSIDKIMLMIVKAVLWFNPVVYLYDKALEQTHEYEADETTSENCGTNHYASLLLRLAISKSEMPLVHNFVKSPIKERIKMLFNSKSKNMKKLMYLLALPIGLGLLWGFTVKVVAVSPKSMVTTQENEFILVLDAGHGGKQTGAKVGKVTEKDITLAMANKIKANAEAKHIKVVLTRNNDEYIELTERAKAKGSILLSLHVNSAPSQLQNGVEMFTSGTYDDKEMKLAKSNSITYYLYKNLKNIVGVKINNKPKLQRLVILDQAAMPGVILELGYLTNKNDFKFITNDQKQNELAKLIVDGVVAYQKASIPTAESAKLQKSMEEFNSKYEAWKKSSKYDSLVAATKTFKSQTVMGNIQSLNYFKRGAIQDIDGFIINANGKMFRVYLPKEQLNALTFKVGDKIAFYAARAEVWFDSNYPVLKPVKVSITPSVGAVIIGPKLKLIFSSSLNVDTKNDINYIKNGMMEIGENKLQAEEISWNTRDETLTAKNFKLNLKDGTTIAEKYIIYDLKRNTYTTNKTPGNKIRVNSDAYELLVKLKTLNDSIKVKTIMDKTLLLIGKDRVKLNIDGYGINAKVLQVDKDSNLITAHIATFTDKNGTQISGDIIEFDLISKNYKVNQPVGAAYK